MNKTYNNNKKNKKNLFLKTNRRIKKSTDKNTNQFPVNYQHNYNYNSYYYQYQSHRHRNHNPAHSSTLEYIQFKLSDLINPNRNKTFIDHLYAQFQADSNKINLVYLPPSEQQQQQQHHREQNEQLTSNLVLLSDQSLNHTSKKQNSSSFYSDTNKLLNEFYLNAAYFKQSKTITSKE